MKKVTQKGLVVSLVLLLLAISPSSWGSTVPNGKAQPKKSSLAKKPSAPQKSAPAKKSAPKKNTQTPKKAQVEKKEAPAKSQKPKQTGQDGKSPGKNSPASLPAKSNGPVKAKAPKKAKSPAAPLKNGISSKAANLNKKGSAIRLSTARVESASKYTSPTTGQFAPKGKATPMRSFVMTDEDYLEESRQNALEEAELARKEERHRKKYSVVRLKEVCHELESRGGSDTELEKEALRLLRMDRDEPFQDLKEVSWACIQPVVDLFIAEYLLSPSVETKELRFKVQKIESERFYHWSHELMQLTKYPTSIGASGSRGLDEVVDGTLVHYQFKTIRITSYAQREKMVREAFAYRVHRHGADQSPTLLEEADEIISAREFYFLMTTASKQVGIEEEDFDSGKYGFRDRVYVRAVELSKSDLTESGNELLEIIEGALNGASEPYVAFAVNLNSTSKFKNSDLFSMVQPRLRLKEEIAGLQGGDNRLYLMFANTQRSRLDLHKMTMSEARARVISFIQEKYSEFSSECLVITGRGNHLNANGQGGMLFKAFPDWVASKELEPIVKKIVSKDGAYRVFLKTARTLVFNRLPDQQMEEEVARAIIEESEMGNNRLKVEIKIEDSMQLVSGVVVARLAANSNHILRCRGIHMNHKQHNRGPVLLLEWEN